MPQTVAVIGSGIAGLTAASLCRRAGFDVTIFESRERLGMDANAVAVNGGLVDMPLRVMNKDGWTAVLELAESVGVGTFPVDVHTSCSWLDRNTWFRNGRMPLTGWPLVGSLRYLNFDAVRLARGMLALASLTRSLSEQRSNITLAGLLKREKVDPLFWRGLILPILKTICTCEEKHLMAWPAAQLLGLLHEIMHCEHFLRLAGGTSALVEALARDIPACLDSAVTRVVPDGDGINVMNDHGEGGCFDRVIVATQANQLDFLDSSPFADEREVLGKIPYASGELWVHSDERFMPTRRSDWTALNFQMDRSLNESMFTVWVNAVEPSLVDKAPVFQTWNPLFEPASEAILVRVPMQRAVVTRATGPVLRQLGKWHAQADRRLYYCGSWAWPGVPLLETGVLSARAVVAAIERQFKAAG
jgi:uncharacterized protein